MIVIFVTIVALFALILTSALVHKAAVKKKSEACLLRLNNAYKDSYVSDEDREQLMQMLAEKNPKHHLFDEKLDRCIAINKQYKYLLSKYDEDKATSLLHHKYWIGMTKEELVDAKGEPSKIEVEQLKTKTKEIYIYGYKSSGDYFVFENGIATKIVDR